MDVAIIGGGPTGLFAAYYAGFRGLKMSILDSLPELGGQVTAFYPEKYIYDVAGFPKVLGKDLIKNLVEQAGQYHPAVFLSEQVNSFERLEDGVLRLTTDKRVHLTRSLIITAGIGLCTPRTYSDPAITSFEDRGLHYFVRSVEDFRDRRLLIVGGGDSALDWALNLEGVCAGITLIHRRDRFRAHQDSVDKLRSSSVDVKVFCELKEVRGNSRVEEALIVNNKSRAQEVLPVDRILACLGFHSNMGPLRQWGIEMEDDSTIRVNSRMETNMPGIYAAGDIAAYPGKLKLIATGFGEAATAVNNSATFVNPEAKLFPGHSSNLPQ